MFATLRALWTRLSRGEKAAWILVLECLLAAAAIQPVVRWADPPLAAQLSFLRDPNEVLNALQEARYRDGPDAEGVADPWGSPWKELRTDAPLLIVDEATGEEVLAPNPKRHGLPYSFGPNRVDEGGEGDDHVIRLRPHAPRTAVLTLVSWGPELLLAVAFCLGWGVAWLRRPRRAGLGKEVLRAVVAASPWAGFLVPWVRWEEERAAFGDPPLLGVGPYGPRALATTAFLGLLLAALAWRLARSWAGIPGGVGLGLDLAQRSQHEHGL